MVRIKGPGPKYQLPTTTGTVNHDPTRTQAPAFSFGVRTKGYDKAKPSAPGPKYDVSGINEHGKIETRQATLLGKWQQSKYARTPGPKSYDTAFVDKTSPAYSFGNKRPDHRKSKVGPGPNKYPPPTCIGPYIPDRKAEPAYSILGRNFSKSKVQGPGPKYMLPEPSQYFNTPPRVALLGKKKQKIGSSIPGPKYNPIPTYLQPEQLKGVTFGVKRSPELYQVLMPEDKVEEAFVL